VRWADAIAAANHAAELIDNRPLSTESYLAFIGSLTRLAHRYVAPGAAGHPLAE
jgi:hypothetical protein